MQVRAFVQDCLPNAMLDASKFLSAIVAKDKVSASEDAAKTDVQCHDAGVVVQVQRALFFWDRSSL